MTFYDLSSQFAIAPMTDSRSINSPPPEYQRVDPARLSLAPVRPPRPTKSQALEDFLDSYSNELENFVPQQSSQPPRKHTRRPALSLTVRQLSNLKAETLPSNLRGRQYEQPADVGHATHIATPSLTYRTANRHATVESDTLPQYSDCRFDGRDSLMSWTSYNEKPASFEEPGLRDANPIPGPELEQSFNPIASRKAMDQWSCYYTFRACAFLTARKALSVLRTPSTTLIALLNPKACVWTDAAEPLLSWMRQFPGVIILESHVPCTVPHIAITEPNLDCEYAAWNNAVPQQARDDGKLLSLVWTARTPGYDSIVDEEWYTSDEQDSELLDDLDFAFGDEDEFDLPSPDRSDTPAPVTPPPYSIGLWRDDTSAAIASPVDCEKGFREHSEESTLSPTAGPSMPMLFVRGDVSFSSFDFPCSVEHDTMSSPTSPITGKVSRMAGFNGWGRSLVSMIMA